MIALVEVLDCIVKPSSFVIFQVMQATKFWKWKLGRRFVNFVVNPRTSAAMCCLLLNLK